VVLAACTFVMPRSVSVLALHCSNKLPLVAGTCGFTAVAELASEAPAGTASPLPFRDGIASPVMCCMLTCASPYTMVPSSGTCGRLHSAQAPHMTVPANATWVNSITAFAMVTTQMWWRAQAQSLRILRILQNDVASTRHLAGHACAPARRA
jgi:hypothetical protein